MPMIRKVLFICMQNSARSQMAEELLKKMAGHTFEIESAGLEPSKKCAKAYGRSWNPSLMSLPGPERLECGILARILFNVEIKDAV